MSAFNIFNDSMGPDSVLTDDAKDAQKSNFEPKVKPSVIRVQMFPASLQLGFHFCFIIPHLSCKITFGINLVDQLWVCPSTGARRTEKGKYYEKERGDC